MPRYFFNVYDGHDDIDREGTELRDLDHAKSEAVNLAGRSIADMGDSFWASGREWLLEVTESSSTVLFALKFSATR